MSSLEVYQRMISAVAQVDPDGVRLVAQYIPKDERALVHRTSRNNASEFHFPLLEYNTWDRERDPATFAVWVHDEPYGKYENVLLTELEQAIAEMNNYYLDPLEKLAHV